MHQTNAVFKEQLIEMTCKYISTRMYLPPIIEADSTLLDTEARKRVPTYTTLLKPGIIRY